MEGASATVQELFSIVDQDKNGTLDFREVTAMFQQLAPEQSAQSAQNAAVEALLMSDKNADTRLNRQEFQTLLTRVAELSGLPLQEAAQRILAATRWQQQQVSESGPAAGPAHTTAAETAIAAGAAGDGGNTGAAAGPSSQSAGAGGSCGPQLQTLFALWDKEGDGRISFTELCQGLAKMGQPAKHKQDITSLIREAAGVLAAHDADGDRQLDLCEFTSFLHAFMSAAGFQLPDVLDHLITLSHNKPDNEKLQKVLAAAEPQIQRLLSQQ